MFDIDITEVGNPMILGCAEEELESKVGDLVGYINHNMGGRATKDAFECAMERVGVDYSLLPSYLKDRIDDEIDIIDDTEEDCW